MMCAKYSTYVYWGTGIVLVLSPRGNFDKRDIILVGIIESKRLSYIHGDGPDHSRSRGQKDSWGHGDCLVRPLGPTKATTGKEDGEDVERLPKPVFFFYLMLQFSLAT